MDTIKSGKMTIFEIFKDNWFNIPDYQRQYSWNEELVETLLDNIIESMEEVDKEYFLGSFVYTYKDNKEEWGLLDGQQRITTIFLILACIRDLYYDIEDIKIEIPKLVYQTESRLTNKPGRSKIEYKIRDDADKFIRDYIAKLGGTDEIKTSLTSIYKEVGVKNMINNILKIRSYFSGKDQEFIKEFVWYLLNRTILVYISSQSLEDAFKMFTVLNSSGLKLRNSDIIKAQNLGNITDEAQRQSIAKKWEAMENTLNEKEDDDAIDRLLLSIVRTIVVKSKARTNLLDQFEKKIYKHYKDKQLLDLIFDYYNIYSSIFFEYSLSNQSSNLITTMSNGLGSTDWVAPVLAYYKKFQEDENFIKFLEKLDNKSSVDWICGFIGSTERIERMNKIIELIEKTGNSLDIFDSELFNNTQHELELFIKNIDEFNVYGRRYCYYILLKLNYIASSNSTKSVNPTLTIEHILPQNPERSSEWIASFNDEQREKLTNKLGNLMLINGKKNSKLGRKPFQEKKEIYFKSSIDAIPYNGFINKYNNWNLNELEENHQKQIDILKGWYFV